MATAKTKTKTQTQSKPKTTQHPDEAAPRTTARRPSPYVRETTERAVDVPVGAALIVADRVNEIVEPWTSDTTRERELKSSGPASSARSTSSSAAAAPPAGSRAPRPPDPQPCGARAQPAPPQGRTAVKQNRPRPRTT